MRGGIQAKTAALLLGCIWAGGIDGRGRAEPTSVPPDRSAGKVHTRLVALRTVGSNVKNPQGEYLGRIEEVAVNPNTGQIEFAMLQINYPAKSNRVTPIPWKVLTYLWDQSQAGGLPGAVQTFNLNMSRPQLERAPTLNRGRWPDLGEAFWLQRIFAYYGVKPSGGLLEASTAAIIETPAPTPAEPPVPYEPGPYAGNTAGGAAAALITDTNFLASLTNAPVPPGATNPIFNTNIFLNRTNFFLNRTNFFPGTRQPFNPADPSTFPPPAPMTNTAPTATNASPVTPASRPQTVASLPPPITGNAPWSPQFADNQGSAQPWPVAPQPNPWSPRFSPGPTLTLNPQPNPWSPRFISPDDPAALPVNPQPNPWSPRFISPSPTDPSLPVNPQPNPWGPRFLSQAPADNPSAAMAAPQGVWSPPAQGVWQPPPIPVIPRAPVIRVAPPRR